MKPKWVIELEDLCAKATPGPWTPVSDLPKYAVAAGDSDIVTSQNRLYRVFEKHHGAEQRNAEFIAAARSALPKLLAVNQKMAEALKILTENRNSTNAELRIGKEALKIYESGVVEQRETGGGEHE